MKDLESVKEFAAKLMKIVSEMRILGENLEDRRVVEKMVMVLPQRFEQKICSLEDTKDLKKISVVDFVNALHMAELCHRRRNGGGAEAALVSHHTRRMQPQQPVDRIGTIGETCQQVLGS